MRRILLVFGVVAVMLVTAAVPVLAAPHLPPPPYETGIPCTEESSANAPIIGDVTMPSMGLRPDSCYFGKEITE